MIKFVLTAKIDGETALNMLKKALEQETGKKIEDIIVDVSVPNLSNCVKKHTLNEVTVIFEKENILPEGNL